MGKKKKITEKVNLFYRGLPTKPNRIADENEMQIIVSALKDCITKKDCAFKTTWNGTENPTPLKLIIGLSSSLRCLKQNRTQALIYDDTAAPHLTKYLNEFASKYNIPIIQAHRLIDVAPDLNLQTLLVISIVSVVSGEERIYINESNPKPKPIKEIVESETFDKLCQLIQTVKEPRTTRIKNISSFKLPVLDRVSSTGISKAKKESRKEKRKANIAKEAPAVQKQTHVVSTS